MKLGRRELLGILVLSLFTIVSVNSQRICYTCDSNFDPACATLVTRPQTPTECPAGDSCITKISRGATFRGCSSEVVPACTAETCSICSEDYCNTDLYPADRLSCHKCLNCDEITSNTYLEVCEIYDSNESCYFYADTETTGNVDNIISERGCYSSTSTNGPTVCDSLESSGKCLKCQENGCNSKATYGLSELTCVKCNSEEDPTCSGINVGPSFACSYNVLLGDPEFCYSYTSAEGVVRKGCLGDADTPTTITTDCNANDPKCIKCSGNDCNREYGSCISCNGVDDEWCASLDGNYQPFQCESSGAVGCFLSKTSGTIRRGCVNELLASELTICELGTTCKICEGDNCNTKVDYQQCYKCDSTDDEACVYAQGEEKKVTCTDYLDECATYIDNGHTIRGCVAETPVPTSCNSATCQVCADSNCNGNVFPSTRLWCHRCVGDTECRNDLANWENTKQICPIYRNPNGCYTLLDDDKVMHRGCNTDPEVDICDENGDSCVKCTTSNCNNAPGVRSPTLSCATCQSNDETCAWAQDDGEICTEQVWFLEEEACYNIYNEQAGTATRGCTLDDKYSCEGQTNCNECNTDSCNKASYKYHSCYICSSWTSDLCLNDATELDISVCRGDSQKRDDVGCYMIKTEENFARGCLANLDPETKAICETEDSICTACYEDGCNDKPGSAASLQSLPIVILVFAWIVQKLY